jgi:hypothetical protein
MRDNFTAKTVDALARRVGMRCSNPRCRKLTSGPRSEPTMSINIGVAAHISAAAPGGPRYDSLLSPSLRQAASNGIWLCQNCAKLIDNDPVRFGVELIRRWKSLSEELALKEVEGSRPGNDLNGAVAELIMFIEIRASRVIEMIEQKSMQGLAAYREAFNRWSNLKPEERNNIVLRYKNERLFRSELASLRKQFVSVHQKHVGQLQQGQLVAAHETVSQAHHVLEVLNRCVESAFIEPKVPPLSLVSEVRYCLRSPLWEENLPIEPYERYPGVFSQRLVRSLPDVYQSHFLVERESSTNQKLLRDWQALRFTFLFRRATQGKGRRRPFPCSPVENRR